MIVKQKYKSDCVLACLAMVTGRKYSSLFNKEFCNKVVEADGCSGEILTEAFKLAGFVQHENMQRIYASNLSNNDLKELLWKRKAMIQVDSLNYEKGQHMIYWDGDKIQDPSTMQVYKWWQHIRPVYIWIFDNYEN